MAVFVWPRGQTHTICYFANYFNRLVGGPASAHDTIVSRVYLTWSKKLTGSQLSLPNAAWTKRIFPSIIYFSVFNLIEFPRGFMLLDCRRKGTVLGATLFVKVVLQRTFFYFN